MRMGRWAHCATHHITHHTTHHHHSSHHSPSPLIITTHHHHSRQVAKEKMEAGELVPDELITRLLVAKLDGPESRDKGWLLDGYPRTEVQAKGMPCKRSNPGRG